MKAVSLQRLREVGTSRPEGYLEEVMRSGRIENDVLFLEDQIYLDLKRKYSSEPRISGLGIPADLLRRRPVPCGNVAANATGAAFRLAKAAMKGEQVRASQSEIDRRLTICKTCEYFVDNPMKCRKCGCFLNLKTRLETEHCPIAKW